MAADRRRDRRCGRPRRASPTRTAGNAAHRRLAAARGATLRRADAGRRPSARSAAPTRSTPAGPTHGAGRVVLAADAWTNELLAHFDRRLPLTVTKEQVTYFAAPDPAAFAPDRFPVWIWMDDPSLLRLPDLRRGRPEGRPGLSAASRPRPRRERSSATRRSCGRVGGFLARAPARRRSGPTIYTKTCLYTLTPDRDFVRRPRCPTRRASSSGSARPRLQVRVGARPHPRRARPRRRVAVRAELGAFRIDRPILLERGPGHELAGLRRIALRAVPCTRPAPCATVPPLGRVRDELATETRRLAERSGRPGGGVDAIAPACPDCGRVAGRRRPHRRAAACPAPLPAAAADGQRSCAPARTRTCRSSTRGTPYSSSTTRSSRSTTTCSSGSARTSQPAPGFAESWSSSDGRHDPHVQDPRRT